MDLHGLQDLSDLGEVGECLHRSVGLEPEPPAHVAEERRVHACGELLAESGERERGLGVLDLSALEQKVGQEGRVVVEVQQGASLLHDLDRFAEIRCGRDQVSPLGLEQAAKPEQPADAEDVAAPPSVANRPVVDGGRGVGHRGEAKGEGGEVDGGRALSL